jgi:hypothetical protein
MLGQGESLKNMHMYIHTYIYIYAYIHAYIHTHVYEAGNETDYSQRLQRMDVNLAVLAKSNEDLISRLPIMIHLDITPSGASSGTKGDCHRMLLNGLKIPFPPARNNLLFSAQHEKSNHNIQFEWSGQNESAGYQTAEDYLRQNGYPHAYVIASGQKLMGRNKELYDEKVFSLRSKAGVKGEALALQARVHGRPDLAICEESADEYYILKYMVDICVELKKAKRGKTKEPRKDESITYSDEMECVINVIGLCASNSDKAPPVVLTDLTSLHAVFYLTKESDFPLKFSIRKQFCASFFSAMAFASELCKDANRRGIARDFGRGPTPPSTIFDSEGDEGAEDSQDLLGEHQN